MSFVDAEEILFVRASSTYVEVKPEPAGFIRIHRSTIINAKAVQHVEAVYWG